MRGAYINKNGEIVRTGTFAEERPGMKFIELADYQIPTELTEAGNLKWRIVNGEVVPANTDAIAAANAREERNRRLAELDTKEAALLRRIRVAQRAKTATTALEAELASLDATKEALCDLPTSSGWPHKITWPVYNG